jgi:D-alanyl-D-alanine carboxypeptidase (penicillin-binding protein 5/6)
MYTPCSTRPLAAALASVTLFTGLALSLPAAGQTAPPALTSKTWVLYDPNTSRVLTEHEGTTRVVPASLTKVMTGYLVSEALRDKKLAPDQMVNVSLAAYRVDKDSSKMYIDPKVPVSIKDLLYGLIIQSGNDAAVQLAEAVSGTEESFAALMNKKAADLGMKGSHFENASGLNGAGHYSTSLDMAVLAAHTIHDFPEDYKIYAIRDWSYNKIKQGNRNLLLYSDPTVDGMKTGHVKESGFNLIASARRPAANGEYRLIAVVTGATSARLRADDAQKLLSWGYANFEPARVATRGAVVGMPVVWKGEAKSVKAGYAEDRFETIAKGTAGKMKTVVTMQDKLTAPLAKGAKIGVAKFSYDDKPVAEVPIVALEDVKEAGFFGRMADMLRMRF